MVAKSVAATRTLETTSPIETGMEEEATTAPPGTDGTEDIRLGRLRGRPPPLRWLAGGLCSPWTSIKRQGRPGLATQRRKSTVQAKRVSLTTIIKYQYGL